MTAPHEHPKDDPCWYSDEQAAEALDTDAAGLQKLVDDGALTPLRWQGSDDLRCFDIGEVTARVPTP